jgi:hypothetical protein
MKVTVVLSDDCNCLSFAFALDDAVCDCFSHALDGSSGSGDGYTLNRRR